MTPQIFMIVAETPLFSISNGIIHDDLRKSAYFCHIEIILKQRVLRLSNAIIFVQWMFGKCVSPKLILILDMAQDWTDATNDLNMNWR